MLGTTETALCTAECLDLQTRDAVAACYLVALVWSTRSILAETGWWQQQKSRESVPWLQYSRFTFFYMLLCFSSILWQTSGWKHMMLVSKGTPTILHVSCKFRKEKLKEGVTCTADTHKAVEGHLASDILQSEVRLAAIFYWGNPFSSADHSSIC